MSHKKYPNNNQCRTTRNRSERWDLPSHLTGASSESTWQWN